MIIKYIGFLFTLLWSYTFIRTQSLFKKGSGFLITLFVSNISWLTFIAACYYGFKNFSIYQAILGIILSIVLVHLAFSRLAIYLNSKFENKNTLFKIKTFLEYLLLIVIGYFIFFLSVAILLITLKFLSAIIISPELGTAVVIAVIML